MATVVSLSSSDFLRRSSPLLSPDQLHAIRYHMAVRVHIRDRDRGFLAVRQNEFAERNPSTLVLLIHFYRSRGSSRNFDRHRHVRRTIRIRWEMEHNLVFASLLNFRSPAKGAGSLVRVTIVD